MLFHKVLLLATAAALVSAVPSTRPDCKKSGPGYDDPKIHGGSSIAYFPDNPKGEPLNVIVTGISDPDTFANWYKAIGYAKECYGIHIGTNMSAHIDARGPREQDGEIRFAYGEDPETEGSCRESIIGGNHFRYWAQQGTGAWFLAASKEKSLEEHHDIIPDGYDIGRDEIATAASKKHKYRHQTFIATVQYVSGLLPTGAKGINHDIALDGKTAVVHVTVS